MRKTRNNITELVFIIDRSGSMAGLEADTVGGFNSMIEKQKRQSGRCYVSTVLFNDKSKVVHDRVALERIRHMTREDYMPGGCTALIDALGDAIKHIAHIHKYSRPEDVPENTIFVITTDGMENASHRYTADEVRRKISLEKEKYGWEFLFIGANIDAIETARTYGIAPDRAVNYRADEKGTRVLYETVARAVCNTRAGAGINADWCDDIARDNRRR